MEISRHAAERYRGVTVLVSGLSFRTDSSKSWENNIHWDAREKVLEIKPHWVLHNDGITHHNYSIKLTLADISSLIDLLGHAGSATDAKLLRDHLAKQVPAIVKLLACATGVSPTPIPDEPNNVAGS